MTRQKITTRKLEDTSWLAQAIQDKMDVEWEKNSASPKWHSLHVLHIVANMADDKDNSNIYYDDYNGKRGITICNIPNCNFEQGSNFDTLGMQCKLRGLAERYKDDDGMYIVSVLTTHDLNSARIYDISELIYQIGTNN